MNKSAKSPLTHILPLPFPSQLHPPKQYIPKNIENPI